MLFTLYLILTIAPPRFDDSNRVCDTAYCVYQDEMSCRESADKLNLMYAVNHPGEEEMPRYVWLCREAKRKW